MKNFYLSKSRRLRSTPFSSRIERQGVKSYTVYNHMLLPTSFSSPEEEYKHLKENVQIWDVSVQREIEILGPDSSELVQFMTCRDLSNSKIGNCYYAPIIDSSANMLNDPLIYKLAEDRWRVCIADSDILLYAKGISSAKNLRTKIFEANVDTLAIQGPKSFKIMEKVFGSKINDLKFFKFDFFKFKNDEFLISRSGYSKQGGFEIHIEDVQAGLKLYDFFFEIGAEFELKPGCPNHIERIEGGLLSYGNDMDIGDNPYECGFDKYINLDSDVKFLGKERLKRIQKEGIKKKLMGVKINTKSISLSKSLPISFNKKVIGELRSGAFSPKFDKVVGIAMLNKDYCNVNQVFQIEIDNQIFKGEVCNLPID